MIDILKNVAVYFLAEGSEQKPIDPGVAILFTALIALVSAGIIVFLFFRTKKERENFIGKDENKNGLIPYDNMKRMINGYLFGKNDNSTVYLYRIDIHDFDDVKHSIGEIQMMNMLKELVASLVKTLPFGVRICYREKDSYLLLAKNKINFDSDAFARLLISTVIKPHVLSGTLTIVLNTNVSYLDLFSGGSTVEEIENSLDLSMSVARRKGFNTFVRYTAQIGNAETEEYRFYSDIQSAMKAREFVLYYQPIVDTETMEVSGAEILTRWNHKTQGVLSPGYFLPLMERTGDINWVGFWCLEQVARQLALWNTNYEQRFDLNINISDRQLMNPELIDEMRKILNRFKMQSQAITLEIADISLYKTSEVAKNNIDKAITYGIKIAAEFGVKCTDISLVENVKMDVIKIESGYWRRAKDNTIVLSVIKTLVEYAKERGTKIVAEGVENVREMNYLRSIGIVYLQGYLFAKPKDPKEYISDVLLTPWQQELLPKRDIILDESVSQDENSAQNNEESVTQDGEDKK